MIRNRVCVDVYQGKGFLQLSTIQALIDLPLFDKLHSLLWVVDLHRAVLREGGVSVKAGCWGVHWATYGHVLLLRPS